MAVVLPVVNGSGIITCQWQWFYHLSVAGVLLLANGSGTTACQWQWYHYPLSTAVVLPVVNGSGITTCISFKWSVILQESIVRFCSVQMDNISDKSH